VDEVASASEKADMQGQMVDLLARLGYNYLTSKGRQASQRLHPLRVGEQPSLAWRVRLKVQ